MLSVSCLNILLVVELLFRNLVPLNEITVGYLLLLDVTAARLKQNRSQFVFDALASPGIHSYNSFLGSAYTLQRNILAPWWNGRTAALKEKKKDPKAHDRYMDKLLTDRLPGASDENTPLCGRRQCTCQLKTWIFCAGRLSTRRAPASE